jgi:hypothetical protein
MNPELWELTLVYDDFGTHFAPYGVFSSRELAESYAAAKGRVVITEDYFNEYGEDASFEKVILSRVQIDPVPVVNRDDERRIAAQLENEDG